MRKSSEGGKNAAISGILRRQLAVNPGGFQLFPGDPSRHAMAPSSVLALETALKAGAALRCRGWAALGEVCGAVTGAMIADRAGLKSALTAHTEAEGQGPRKGVRRSDMTVAIQAGSCRISDDGRGVMNEVRCSAASSWAAILGRRRDGDGATEGAFYRTLPPVRPGGGGDT